MAEKIVSKNINPYIICIKYVIKDAAILTDGIISFEMYLKYISEKNIIISM